MQKVHNILITDHATQIAETAANVYEWFLENSFEVSPRKFLKNSKVKYIYQENNGYIYSGSVLLPEAGQIHSNPHTEDFRLLKNWDWCLYSENYQKAFFSDFGGWGVGCLLGFGFV